MHALQKSGDAPTIRIWVLLQTQAPPSKADEAPNTKVPPLGKFFPSLPKLPATEAPVIKVSPAKAPNNKVPAVEAPVLPYPATAAPQAKAPESKAPTARAMETASPTTVAPLAKPPVVKAPEGKPAAHGAVSGGPSGKRSFVRTHGTSFVDDDCREFYPTGWNGCAAGCTWRGLIVSSLSGRATIRS